MQPATETRNDRILVIDDNPAIHADFQKILAKPVSSDNLDAMRAELFGDDIGSTNTSQFEIESAYQGEEGFQRIKDSLHTGRPYAMAFIDVRMPPGWDGLETTLKIWEICPDLQVVICTAYSDYSWEQMSAQLGRSDRLLLLKKPFDNIEVLQMAHAMTEKWHLHKRAQMLLDELEAQVEARTAELRESEAQFRAMFDLASVGMAQADPLNGRFLCVNAKMCAITGYSAAEMLQLSVREITHPEDRPQDGDAFQRLVRGAIPDYRLEKRYVRKDGTHAWVNVNVTVIRDRLGQATRTMAVIEDITDRRQSELERQRMEAQLHQAQKLEAIGQLAAGIAHEINTPTQYIGDNVHFFKKAFDDLDPVLEAHQELVTSLKQRSDQLPEPISRLLNGSTDVRLDFLRQEIPNAIGDALEGVDRVTRIVRAMKEFSHPGEEEKQPVDLNHAIESTLTVSRNEWKYVANMVTHFAPNLPLVPCLPGEFNQVILNLVVNAADAIAEVVGKTPTCKGTMTVSTQVCGPWAEIRVQDTGAGIPEPIRNRVFNPFFTTKQAGKGSGQGLAIAHSVIVEKHGGTIEFESQVGQGTTFLIRLPLESAETTQSETNS